MQINEILNLKKSKQVLFRNSHKIPSKNKILWLILIDDKTLRNSLIEWFWYLPVDFVFVTKKNLSDLKNIFCIEKISEEENYAFDFILCDECEDKLLDYLKYWITPIVNKKYYLNHILSEFNSMKNEWNAFLFNEFNKYDIFFAIARYIENYKYPYDNKNLIKNILQIQ